MLGTFQCYYLIWCTYTGVQEARKAFQNRTLHASTGQFRMFISSSYLCQRVAPFLSILLLQLSLFLSPFTSNEKKNLSHTIILLLLQASSAELYILDSTACQQDISSVDLHVIPVSEKKEDKNNQTRSQGPPLSSPPIHGENDLYVASVLLPQNYKTFCYTSFYIHSNGEILSMLKPHQSSERCLNTALKDFDILVA